ncbi:hypothetical protein N9N28_03315 [Rubripirellula amarantea]|nr:hypothetical protein [Rubripirellula amarantea]
MAIDRLSIILVHRAGKNDAGGSSAALDKLTEQLVGNLLGRPGIDVTLVGPLDDLQPGSTDALTLESMTGDVAVLTRVSIDQAMVQLASLGFAGQRARHLGDPTAPVASAAARRIYAFDLHQPWTIQQWIDALERLRQVKSVKTFDLMPGASRSVSDASKPVSPRFQAEPIIKQSAHQSRPVGQSGSPPSDGHLDDLLDQLDQSDL